MTRAEAIYNLNTLAEHAIEDDQGFTIEEALYMAINSLKVDEMYQLEMEDADEFISKKVIEDIKAEIKTIQQAEIQIYGKENWDFSGKCLDVIDKHISRKENNGR